MSIFSFFKKDKVTELQEPEQAVIITVDLESEFGDEKSQKLVHQLGDSLDKAVDTAEVGEYDGDEFGDNEAKLYLYGPDAQKLYSVIEPTLLKFKIRPVRVLMRFGDVDDLDAKEKKIVLP